MYSDLDKKVRGGEIIEDALVLNEIFETAINVRKGQIFYGRDFGIDLEYYLLKLNEPDTIMNIQSELYQLQNMDGRLILDPSKTKLFTDDADLQLLIIQAMIDAKGLPQVSVSGLVADNEEQYPNLEDFLNKENAVWAESSFMSDKLVKGTNTEVSLSNGKKIKIADGKLRSIS